MSGYREICLIFVLVCLSPAILERRSNSKDDFPAFALNYIVMYEYKPLLNESLTQNCSLELGQKFLSDAFVAKSSQLQDLCDKAIVNVKRMAIVEVQLLSHMKIKTSLNITMGGEDGGREVIESCYRRVNETILDRQYVVGLYSLNTELEGCPSLEMSPRTLNNTGGGWFCSNNGSYNDRIWSCLPGGVTPSTPYGGGSSGLVSPPPESSVPDTGSDGNSTAFPDMTTPEMKNQWGIKLLQDKASMSLAEGNPASSLPFNVWVNRTKLCGAKKNCRLSVDIDIYDDNVHSNPICRRTGRSIPQVVAGHPKVSLKDGNNFCSIAIPEDQASRDDVLPLKAVIDGKYDGNQRRYLTISLTKLTGKNDKEVLREKKITIPIDIEDQDRKSTCQSINDPHITTFDGLEYNNFFEGEYILYQHDTLPIRVDVVYQKCEQSVNASCNCAVAVQSGDDVIVIDRCYRDRSNIPSNNNSRADKDDTKRNRLTRMSVQLYKSGKLTPGTSVYQEADGKKYFIYLPNGAYIKVMVSGELVNAWVVASPTDFKQTSGLCGYYSSKKEDDFKLKNGTILSYPSIVYDGERGQPKAYIDYWRIDLYGSSSILSGVPPAIAEYEPEQFCTCERDLPENVKNFCSYVADISNCDVLRGKDVTSWLVSRSVKPRLSSKRKKRQSDNTISIFANEPPIKIDKKFVPPSYHWNSRWNEATAKDHCKRYIKDEYELGRLCSSIPGVDFDREFKTCIEDIKITKNTSWADSARDAMKEQCLEAVQKNSSLPNDIAHKIENAICINDCSSHGDCVQGMCKCHIGYVTADCSVNERLPPYSAELPTFGLCDVRNMNCSHVIVYGQDFIPSPNLTCFLRECEVTDSELIPSDVVIKVKGTFVNFNAVECPVPSLRSYLISVSNNGVNASQALLFIPFDPVCNTCNAFNKTCKRKHNSCRIDGKCYRAGEHSPTDECLVCEPVDDGFQWTTRKDLSCPSKWWDRIQLPDWVVAVVAAVGGSLIGVLVGFLLYKCCCKSKKAASGGDVTLDGTAADPDGPPAFEDAMLHRNRGLHVFPSDRFTDMDLPHVDEYEESYFYNGDGRGVENGVDSTTYF